MGASALFAPLPAGPLDIVGDVHGEAGALQALLVHLGYDAAGRHPAGRTLVFVGDLCDRGPDSPAVLRKVGELVEAGRAAAVLGNHELNLLRGERKDGNDWFWNEGSARDRKYAPSAPLAPALRRDVLAFFGRLPLVLERADLRIVHAAWDAASIAALRQADAARGLQALFDDWDAAAEREIERRGLGPRAQAEMAREQARLLDPRQPVPMLAAVAEVDELRQTANPIRVVTSGLEKRVRAPFFASGHWRFVERVRWWDDYADAVPVVVGHYWRHFARPRRAAFATVEDTLFAGLAPTAWHGRGGAVFCVDFSVGGRFMERPLTPGTAPFTRLAALRWPERMLVLDTGEHLPTH